MEQYKNIDSNLRKLFDKAEELDWTVRVYEETYHGERTYAELYKYSPAGEDFSMVIDFDKENQADTFLEDLDRYLDGYDADEHAEMWLESRGKGGCPSSLRELLDDAEAIEEMIRELRTALEAVEQEA